MARYRKIDVRLWGDEKFLALSPIPPCGQGLWLYLLTNPNTNSIPGLFRAGEAQLAEELGWDLKAFREAFREALSKGLVKADWKARLVWIPNGAKYNRPESPNVVTGWASSWDELPECSLKAQSYESLKAFTEGLGEAFAKAFVKACPKPLANQEQEQEHEQEQEKDLALAAPEPDEPKPTRLTDDLAFSMIQENQPLLATPEIRAYLEKWFAHRRKKKWAMNVTWWAGQVAYLGEQGSYEAALSSMEKTSRNLYQGLVPGDRSFQKAKPKVGGSGALFQLPERSAEEEEALERNVIVLGAD